MLIPVVPEEQMSNIIKLESILNKQLKMLLWLTKCTKSEVYMKEWKLAKKDIGKFLNLGINPNCKA